MPSPFHLTFLGHYDPALKSYFISTIQKNFGEVHVQSYDLPQVPHLEPEVLFKMEFLKDLDSLKTLFALLQPSLLEEEGEVPQRLLVRTGGSFAVSCFPRERAASRVLQLRQQADEEREHELDDWELYVLTRSTEDGLGEFWNSVESGMSREVAADLVISKAPHHDTMADVRSTL
jgi:hypothetical protein